MRIIINPEAGGPIESAIFRNEYFDFAHSHELKRLNKFMKSETNGLHYRDYNRNSFTNFLLRLDWQDEKQFQILDTALTTHEIVTREWATQHPDKLMDILEKLDLENTKHLQFLAKMFKTKDVTCVLIGRITGLNDDRVGPLLERLDLSNPDALKVLDAALEDEETIPSLIQRERIGTVINILTNLDAGQPQQRAILEKRVAACFIARWNLKLEGCQELVDSVDKALRENSKLQLTPLALHNLRNPIVSRV